MPETITIIDALKRRRLEHQNGNVNYKDGLHIGLTVEGGAMRGIVSLGMLLALKDLHLLPYFDVYAGVSSGSANLAYALSEHTDSLRVYYEALLHQKAVKLSRIVPGGKHVIDSETLRRIHTQELYRHQNKLLQNYGSKFLIAVTDMHNYSGSLHVAGDDAAQFQDYLLAGAALPVLSDGILHAGKRVLCDGYLYYPHPLMMHPELNCTHLLVLQTKTVSDELFSSVSFERKLASLHLLDVKLAELVEQRRAAFLEAYTPQYNHEFSLNDGSVAHIVAVEAGQHHVKQGTDDPWHLLMGAKAGYDALARSFSPGSESVLIPRLVHHPLGI